MRRAIGLLSITVAFAAACGENAIDPVTGGEGNGATGFDVLITDDPTGTPTMSGEMTGSIRVALRNDAGALVNLGVMQGAEVQLQDEGDTLRLTDLSRPPADDYTGIQLQFEGVDVRLDSGSEVGDTTLTSNVVLDVGAGSAATVEIAFPTFSVDNDSETAILVDLNSEDWITRANIEDAAVPEDDLVNSVTVEVD